MTIKAPEAQLLKISVSEPILKEPCTR